MGKIVYRLLRPACYGLTSLAVLFSLSACGSDSEGTPTNDIAIKSISPESPATLDFYETSSNDRVIIQYDYNISNEEGARIWIQPFTNGSISNEYLYSKSSILKGGGSRSVLVSIDAGAETKVDQLRIKITNPDQSVDLMERFVDVDYTFK